MSLNEFALLSFLVGIGVISGAAFGWVSARKGMALARGMLPALLTATLIPIGVIFLFALLEVSPRSGGLSESLGAALGITLFYGIGSTVTSGLAALVSCWLAFESQGPA